MVASKGCGKGGSLQWCPNSTDYMPTLLGGDVFHSVPQRHRLYADSLLGGDVFSSVPVAPTTCRLTVGGVG